MPLQLSSQQVWQAIEKELFAVLGIVPEKEFIIYGVGVPLMQMRHPEQARGRAPTVA